MTAASILIIFVITTVVIIILWYMGTLIKETKNSFNTMKSRLAQMDALTERLLLENRQIKDSVKSLISVDLQNFMSELKSKGMLDERLTSLLEILKQKNQDKH